MKCPLCDMEFGDDLVSHFDNEHGELSYRITYDFSHNWCEIPYFRYLVKHYHSIEHLTKMGQIEKKIAELKAQKDKAQAEVIKRTKQVVELQEILRKRD